MKVKVSYKAEIKSIEAIASIKATAKIYREAVAYLIGAYETDWNTISSVDGKNRRFNYAEHLVHSTKNNMAKYDFDILFTKMPSYLRRAAIAQALGAVSSYHSNYDNWLANGCKGKAPSLQLDRYAMPVFYDMDMSKASSEPNCIQLKLFCNNDWVWHTVRLRATDVKYIQKRCAHCQRSAPVLEKRYGRYYLRFLFEQEVALSNTSTDAQKVCAVDLGINTDAACSILDAKGTVLARKFINFPSEKDHLYRLLGRIKRQQREHGPYSVTSLWQYARRCNDELAKKISEAITEFAVRYSVDAIVFEHLDSSGKIRGSKKQKLHLWKKNSIQQYTETKAHKCGIRISRICAWGTSALAYDGSGRLTRDEHNHSLATFANGKQYNCDLSASYNIGARYFIREILKPLSESKRSRLAAEVPLAVRRTTCTLSTLWQLSAAMCR